MIPLDAAAVLFSVDGIDDTISYIDPDSGAVLSTIRTPVDASGMGDGLAYDGTRLFFSGGLTTVFELELGTGAVVNSFALGTLLSLDALGWGQTSFGAGPTLFALDFGLDQVSLLNPSNGSVFTTFSVTVDSVTVDLRGGMDFNPATGTLFVSDAPGLIHELNAETGAILNSFLQPGSNASGIGFDGGRMFVSDGGLNTIYELNPANGAVLNSFPAPDAAASALTGGPLPTAVPSLGPFGLAALGALLLAAGIARVAAGSGPCPSRASTSSSPS